MASVAQEHATTELEAGHAGLSARRPRHLPARRGGGRGALLAIFKHAHVPGGWLPDLLARHQVRYPTVSLTVDNIDFLRRVVYVRRQLRHVENQTVFAPPKGGREREVPLPDVVSLALAEHVRRYGTSDVVLPWREPGGEAVLGKPLFTNRDRGPLTRAY